MDFIKVKMSKIISSFQGKSEHNVAEIFDLAEFLGPAIIYIGKLFSVLYMIFIIEL